MAKTLAVAIQQFCAVFLNQSQGVTLESESTCSLVSPDLRRDRQACQQAKWNTWVGKDSQPKPGLLTCFTTVWISHYLFCLFTLDGWTSVGSSLSVASPASWSWLTTKLHTGGCVHSLMCSNTGPADIVKKTQRSIHREACTYTHVTETPFHTHLLTPREDHYPEDLYILLDIICRALDEMSELMACRLLLPGMVCVIRLNRWGWTRMVKATFLTPAGFIGHALLWGLL